MRKAALRSSRSPDQGSGWIAASVSSRSRFGDDVWLLDIQTAGWRGGPEPGRLEHRIASERADHADRSRRTDRDREALPLDDGDRSTVRPQALLREDAQEPGSRSADPSSLDGRGRDPSVRGDRPKGGWALHGLAARPAGTTKREGALTPLTMVNYMIVLKDSIVSGRSSMMRRSSIRCRSRRPMKRQG